MTATATLCCPCFGALVNMRKDVAYTLLEIEVVLDFRTVCSLVKMDQGFI